MPSSYGDLTGVPEQDRLRTALHKKPGDDRDLCRPLPVTPVIGADTAAGIIRVAYIDSDEIKACLPCIGQVRDTRVPAWSSHWPGWCEGFDRAAE